MNVILKPFKTPRGNYIYDRETNSILSVSSEQYDAFQRIIQNEPTDQDIKILELFQNKGYCKESSLEHIEHPQDKFLEFHLEKEYKS